LLEVREVVPEDQAPSPSLAAFNKSFGTSHHGELLSVGFETTGVGSKMSKILTLCKSPVIVDETGGESSEQPGGAARDSEKGPHPTPEATPSSQGKASSGSTKQVTMQHFSKQGSFLFITFSCFFRFSNFDLRLLISNFSEFKDLLHSYSPSKLARFQEDYTLKYSMLGKVAVERLAEQEKANKRLSQESKELKRSFTLTQSANIKGG
jgi:hypothetical protein